MLFESWSIAFLIVWRVGLELSFCQTIHNTYSHISATYGRLYFTNYDKCLLFFYIPTHPDRHPIGAKKKYSANKIDRLLQYIYQYRI